MSPSKAKSKNYFTKLIESTKYKKNKEFIKQLYSEVALEDLAHLDIKHLDDSANSLFELFKVRKENKFKVNIFRKSPDSDYAVIEVVTKEMPFIIDSLSNEMKNQQCNIHLIVHPIFSVKRDSNGNFKSICETSGTRECLIQFHISNWFDKDKLKEIQQRIIKIMECIHYGVSDWRVMMTKMNEAIDHMKETNALRNNDLRDESISFLEWLLNNHLVFLGCYETDIKGDKISPVAGSQLGVVRSDYYNLTDVDSDSQYRGSEPIFIRKWDSRSLVHRTAHLDLIVVKKYNNIGECVGAYHFLGLFTSTVYYQSVRQIPLMRKKVGRVIEKYGYPESSHNCKELITALESFPRGELLQMSVDELYETATGIVSLMLVPRVKVFIRRDITRKFTSCIIFIPEKRFNSDTRMIIEKILCNHLGGTVSKKYVHIGETSLTRLQLIIRNDGETKENYSIKHIEKDIMEAISIWSDQLSESLTKYHGKREAITLFNKYKDAFDVKYCSFFTGSQAVHDIKLMEQCFNTSSVGFDIYISSRGGASDFTQLKIYSPDRDLPLSETLPLIENLGFKGIDEVTYPLKLIQDGGEEQRKIYIHHFKLLQKRESPVVNQELHDNVISALQKIWSGELEDDIFNSLIMCVGASWREAMLLRAFAKYLKLTNFPHQPQYVFEALSNNLEITQKLIKLFNIKFDPSIKQDAEKLAKLSEEITNNLGDVKSISEDRVLRSYLQLIESMKRTNFYQLDESGNHKPYISFKISSQELEDLPLPRPYAEIFVYSSRLEAIHLRGGKVARGGLRWSDRKEDFRTEVLGLMKAQMTKNSVIVPVGSKGGFIVKKVSMLDGRDEFLQEGVECYKTFLSGLLDITDNIVKNEVINPKSVVRHDDNDPYLVVAADKGTATFSDYANSVSAKYGFWLGDAFASGGSVGYDHKKMGITAKGAWISVQNHFDELGTNIQAEPFTVAGIGDMSGDVFGNGMLLSKAIKLVAAFNHMHIFVDPNPDPAKSFKERERMFNLPRSQWTDYNEKLISNGGGIFDRKQKSISLSAEMKKLLDVKDNSLSPDNLIKAILKAPVDLLWNGGIGTYVKSAKESNEKIGDKANDCLRINGKELRCKVIGEGGNLGFTQLGRIEFARNGGRANTDFIDNSAGVDCSDHEVNLKIAMSDQVLSGKMKMAARDTLLTRMTDEVGELVLDDNRKQNLILKIEELNPKPKIYGHQWIMKHLESKGELKREIEFLPKTNEINALIAEGKTLTRPEISVIIAYAKNSIDALLSNYEFTFDSYLKDFLYNYFPTEFRNKQSALIDTHKLKNEILATVLTNEFVNKMGSVFFHQILDEKGESPENIIKAFVIVKEIYNIDYYWDKIGNLSSSVDINLKINLYSQLQALMERNILWFINNVDTIKNVEQTISEYKSQTSILINNIENYVTKGMKDEYLENIELYKGDDDLVGVAKEICKLRLAKTVPDVIFIAKKSKTKIEDAAHAFYKLGENLHFSWLISQTRLHVPKIYYQTVAVRALVSELQEIQIMLTERSLQDKKSDAIYSSANDNYIKYNKFIDELKSSIAIEESIVALITIAINKVKALAK